MLHTDQLGERRIRILNYSWRVAKTLYGFFKSADADACSQIKLRCCIASMMPLGAKKAKEKLINDLIEMLYSYRKHCC